MKEDLAKRILAKTLNWDPLVLEDELHLLQMMASLKYDEYQQFSNGKRFLESLALWLRRFHEEERQQAYDFIKNNLIFISEREMLQLISVSFDDFIRPKILKRAKANATSKYFSGMDNRKIYNFFLRKTLFLGLSDGAHMDYFRRSHSFLNNEQVFMHYDFSKKKYEDMRNDLRKDLFEKYPEIDSSKEDFCSFVLIDDFSGSGISYIRKEQGANGYEWKGKVYKFLQSILERCQESGIIDIHIVLYVATRQAIENIQKNVDEYISKVDRNVRATVEAVQIVAAAEGNEQFERILKRDYDSHRKDEFVSFVDNHYLKGKAEKPYLGFNECGLVMVLYHNTPNNSVPIIWHSWIKENARDFVWDSDEALFPRVTRHKEN